jgi:hypothetical protein
MPATMISARSMKAPAQVARVHAKPRTGVWPQQVVGAWDQAATHVGPYQGLLTSDAPRSFRAAEE